MTALADFLLARIAEDEAPTWELHPYACEPGCCAPAGWVGSQCRYCDAAPVYGGTVAAITVIAEEHAEAIHQRSRVLAECEAKRRIVEYAARADQRWAAGSPMVGYRAASRDTMKAIALPYAEHPDYRKEWRP